MKTSSRQQQIQQTTQRRLKKTASLEATKSEKAQDQLKRVLGDLDHQRDQTPMRIHRIL